MKTWPLRRRLTAWSALITGFALLTFGAIAALNLYFEQLEFLDHRLSADADLFFSELPEHGSAGWESTEHATLLLRGSGPLFGFAIGPTNGSLDHAHPAALGRLFPAWPPPTGFSTARLDRRRLRVGVFTKAGRTLVLSANLHPIEDMVGDLFVAYLLALPVVLVVVGVGSWWIARRALQPIADITAAAAAITAERLDARLGPASTPDEIGRLTDVLNAMFDRLQHSFEQATRFTADASHELRTPLTILRGEIEDALRSGKFGPEQEPLLVSLLEQTSGLQKIAENLLLLSRFDSGKAPLALEPLDFSQLAAEAAEDAELLAAAQSIALHKAIAPGVRVRGDAIMLRRLLLNLIDNAVCYNRPGGEVRLDLRGNTAGAELRVTNTGVPIPAERKAALFQRFFRSDADRNRSTGGSGLGLSLCREIATAHGGNVELVRSEHDTTEFRVWLPDVRDQKPHRSSAG